MGPIPISPVPCSPTYRGSTVLRYSRNLGLCKSLPEKLSLNPLERHQ